MAPLSTSFLLLKLFVELSSKFLVTVANSTLSCLILQKVHRFQSVVNWADLIILWKKLQYFELDGLPFSE